MSSNQELIIQQIEALRTAMSKKHRWYTGLPIKTYIKKVLFSLFSYEAPKNLPLESGRWSAYCHYSQEKAFENLLEKHSISSQSMVLVHPLTPSYLIDKLIAKQCKVQTIDIDLNTLTFNSEGFDKFLETFSQVDLIIHYSKEGLLLPITSLMQKTQHKTIPHLVIYDNDFVNIDLISLIQTQTIGSFLWLAGDSFWDDMLNNILPSKLESKPWYLSWYIENRTLSILEYHLTESQDQVVPLVESYYQILVESNKSTSMFSGIYYSMINKYMYSLPKKTLTELQNQVVETYQKSFESAVPDIVFDLKLLESTTIKRFSKEDLSDFSHLLQTSQKKLVESLLKENYQIIIPKVFTSNTYLYTWMVTEDRPTLEQWSIQHSLSLSQPQKIHQIITAFNLPNVRNFVEKGVVINLLENFSVLKHF
jgi:hypothetical protein